MAATRLIEYLGGMEKLEKEAPHVLEFLQGSVSRPPVDNCYIGSRDNVRLRNGAGMQDDAKPMFLGVEEVYSDAHGIHTLMRADFDGVQKTIDIIADLYNAKDERKIDTQSVHFDNTAYAEFNMISDGDYAKQSSKGALRIEAEFTWSDDEETANHQKITFYVNEYKDEKPVISSIQVEAPRAKDGKVTQILYDRRSWVTEKTDYHYENVMQDGGKKAKLMMPFKGRITVEDGLQIKGILTSVETEKPKLYILLEQGGSAEYSNPKTFVSQCMISDDKKSISWDLDADWNQSLNLERMHVETIVDLSCIFTLRVVDSQNPSTIYMPRVMINSVSNPQPHEAGSGVCEIEKINIKWGCLAEDTMIEMGNGGQKKISEIKIGDMVKTESGCASVINIYSGMEDELVHLETKNGHILKMTKSHPVKTIGGFISASDLTAADVIATVDGDSMVKYVFMENYGKKVYNLELDKSEAILCNGIIAGDFLMQNTFLEKKEQQESLSVLQEEFARLYKDIEKKQKQNKCSET